VVVAGGGAGAVPGAAGAAGGAVKTGIGVAGKMFLIGEAIGLVAAVEGVRDSINADSTKHAEAINDQTTKFIAAQPDQAALTKALAGVDTGIHDLTSNPLLVLVQGEALTNLQQMKAKLTAALAENRDRLGDITPGRKVPKDDGARGDRSKSYKALQLLNQKTDKNEHGAKADRSKAYTKLIQQTQKLDLLKASSDGVRDRVESAKIAQVGATNTQGSNIVAAVHGIPPPTVNVYNKVNVSATNLTKLTTIVRRAGPEGGSKNTTAHKKR
jgi:hypothetical protein